MKTLCVVTYHDEDPSFLKKCLRSIEASVAYARNRAKERDFHITVVATGKLPELDFEFEFPVIEDGPKEIAPKRSLAAKTALENGYDFVFMIDADDMISENFLLLATSRESINDKKSLVHPQFSFYFSAGTISCTRAPCFHDEDYNSNNFIQHNNWPSCVLGDPEFIYRHYKDVDPDYGYEDLAFNQSTMLENYSCHEIAHGSAFFGRRRENSRSMQQLARKEVFIASEILNSNPEMETAKPSNTNVRLTPMDFKYVIRRAKDIVEVEEEISDYQLALDELIKIHDIEPMIRLIPGKNPPVIINKADVVNEWFQFIGEFRHENLILCPWIGVGGGDKYIRNLRKFLPDAKIIVTDYGTNRESPIEEEGVFDFGFHFRGKNNDGKIFMLHRFIGQTKPKRIMNVLGGNGFLLLKDYAWRFKDFAKCIVFSFNNFSMDGWNYSPLYEHIDSFKSHVLLVTDNTRWSQHIKHLHGVESVVLEPHCDLEPKYFGDSTFTNVLWANRIAPEKGLERLASIIDNEPNRNFWIAGKIWDYNTTNDVLDILRRPNVKYIGQYSSMSELLERVPQIDSFLCTSRSEGYSNTSLEAAALGLPVVTYNNGGHVAVSSCILGDDVVSMPTQTHHFESRKSVFELIKRYNKKWESLNEYL